MKQFWILFAVVVLLSTAKLLSQLSFEVVWEKPQGGVIDAKFSPDGKFVYCLIGGDIKKLEVETGEFVATFNRDGFTNKYAYLELSQDGKYILTGGYDGSVNLWNTEQQKIIRSLSIPEQTEKQTLIFSTFSPDNRTVLVTLQTSHDFPKKPTNEIVLYDFIDNKVIRKVPFKRIGNIQFSKNGNYFITGTKYEDIPKVTLWDANTLKPIRDYDVPEGNDNGFRKIQISDNNKLIGVRTDTYHVKIIDTESGNVIKTNDVGMMGSNFELLPNDYYIIHQWEKGNFSNFNSNIFLLPDLFQSDIKMLLSGVILSKEIDDTTKNKMLIFQQAGDFMTLLTNSTTSVNDPTKPDFKINVESEKIIISYDHAENIKIVDLKGRILLDIEVSGSSASIPNTFAPGTYICVVKSGGREFSQKFQVVR